ncbi:MAG TPA: hypothetical protein VJ827_04730 [Rubrobacter sp.]|nr:hypothetical protein [Rubrobacter sp.]
MGKDVQGGGRGRGAPDAAEVLDPVAILSEAVESYAPYLQRSGEMHDPVFGEPTQYGTPYYAFCNAVLAGSVGGERGLAYVDRAVRGLEAAIDHVSDPGLPPTASGFDPATGAVIRSNHRDFFWPPILKTFRILRHMGVDGVEGLVRRISAVDIEGSFASRPPSNWAAVWLSGEWLRLREGLSPYSTEEVDLWLDAFFDARILIEQGFYQEPGHPNSYDLFTRYHLADMLMEGYDGRRREDLESLMRTGLHRSLDVQLSDGSLASAHRSTGQTWTLGAQCAYFTHAATHFRGREPELAGRAEEAAYRALSSFRRWQRKDGPYSPVENRLPPGNRVGYERYTADGHYATLAAAFLAVAVSNGFYRPASGGRKASVRLEHDPIYRAVMHNGSYSLHVNGRPAPDYDAFGLVDLTFGPGRYLQFVSCAKHLESGSLLNLGMQKSLSQGELALIGPMERHGTSAGVRLQARRTGSPHNYRLAARVETDGVYVEEATPRHEEPKTLLVPYLRDAGTGAETELRVEAGKVRLIHGREEVEVSYGAPVKRVVHLTGGFESRRGLCGLLRIEFRKMSERIYYRIRATR